MGKLIMLFILLPILTIAQTKTIEAELIDFSPEKIPAYCGYQTEWGILKFKISKSINDLKKDQIILVSFQCPRETMENNIGISAYKNHQEYLITIGNKIRGNEILEQATKMFVKDDENNFLIFPMSELKEIE